MNRVCPNCGKMFEPVNSNQLYCCKRCQWTYVNRHKHGVGYASVTFTCAMCGHTVVTEGGRDKRSRFCSPECEKRYWRHPPYECESNRTNFHTIDEYASWERRTNE